MGIGDYLRGSDPRRDRFEELCSLVDLSFQQFRKAGQALREIRDDQLYTLTHRTFADFCKERWNITPTYASRLISATSICELLGPAGELIETENQARQVKQLDEAQRSQLAIDITTNRTPIVEALKKHLPIGNKSKARPKPIRYRLPGCTLIIEPNRKYPGIEATIGNLLKFLEQKNAA